MTTTEPNRRLVMVGRRVAGSTTLDMTYDSTHHPAPGFWKHPDTQPEPDYDFIRKQRIEQDLSEGDKS